MRVAARPLALPPPSGDSGGCPERGVTEPMRAVIHLNDYDYDETVNDDGPDDPHADERSVVPGVETEWYRGGGNVHVVDDDTDMVADTVAGNVIIDHPALDSVYEVENASLVAVYPGK